MAYPVRSRATVDWLPPLLDRQVNTHGWCADHHMVDPRKWSGGHDPTRPPTPSEWYWRFANTGDIVSLPGSGGAILAPRHIPLHTPNYLVPSTATGFDPGYWYDADTHPDSPWVEKGHEEWARTVAMFTPASVLNYGRIRTVDTEPPDRAHIWWYYLMVPLEAATWYKTPPHGLRFHLGVQSDIPQLTMVLHQPDQANYSSVHWTLWAWESPTTYRLLDKFEQPTKYATQGIWPTMGWVSIMPINGSLYIRHSMSEEVWVYKPPAWDPANPSVSGCYIRPGYNAADVVGTRGWVKYGWVTFPGTTEVTGPDFYYPDWVTFAGEARLKGETSRYDTPAGDASYTAAFVEVDAPTRRGHCKLTVTNNSAADTAYVGDGMSLPTAVGYRRTPVLFSLQEVHRATLNAPTPVWADLEEHGQHLSLSWEENGRGATGTLTLKNWQYGEYDYELGPLNDVVRGMGRVNIQFAHQYSTGDSPFLQVFNGYLTRVVWKRDTENGIWPQVELSLQDRTCLWAGERATMVHLPDVAGWDFKEATELLLEHHGVHLATETLYPADYPANPQTIPWQVGTASMTWDPMANLMDVLDRLCSLCYMRWSIDTYGRVVFQWSPEVVSGPTWTLDEDTVTEVDRIELPVESSQEYSEGFSVSYAKGRDRWGAENEALYHYTPAIVTPTYDGFLGRKVWAATVEADNPYPGRVAQRRLYWGQQRGRALTWKTLGRNLWPGDIVAVEVDHLDIPSGAWFKVVGKRSEFSMGETPNSLLWEDSYVGEVVRMGVTS